MKAADLFDLTGRVALVTGASRGIGEAIARCLAANGAEVIVVSRKLDACEHVAASIRADGGRARAYACHQGDLAAVDALFAWLGADVGGLDILVNNAATNPLYGSVLQMDAPAFAKTVDVNLRGTWFMCTHAARMMTRSGGGSIINVASVAAERPMAGLGLYGATKAAVVNLTQAFAKELAPSRIRVNALLPGLVNTQFAAALQTDADVRERALAAIPLGYIADPADMVGAALYLASDASRYTTGATLRVDGGLNS